MVSKKTDQTIPAAHKHAADWAAGDAVASRNPERPVEGSNSGASGSFPMIAITRNIAGK